MQVEAYSERSCKLVVKRHRLRGWLAGSLVRDAASSHFLFAKRQFGTTVAIYIHHH